MKYPRATVMAPSGRLLPGKPAPRLVEHSATAPGGIIDAFRDEAGVLCGDLEGFLAEGARFVAHLHQFQAFVRGEGDQQVEIGFQGGEGSVDALQAVGLERHGDAVLCHVIASFQVVPAGSGRHTQSNATRARCSCHVC